MAEKWLFDERGGCMAVYPYTEDMNRWGCLDTAHEWAIYYRGGRGVYGKPLSLWNSIAGRAPFLHWETDPEDVRIGRLIAAAPELLAACKLMAGLIAESAGLAGFHLNGDIAEWGEFPDVDDLQAAIAKATGDS